VADGGDMNVLETITEVTGVKRPDLDSIFQKVKANSKTLEECAGPHDFSICLDRRSELPVEKPVFGCKWKCAKCGGIVEGTVKLWYDRGLAHRASETSSPINLNEAQELDVKQWAADDRLWSTQETVEFNLRTFARVVLKNAK
jgi:hypothetical protein